MIELKYLLLSSEARGLLTSVWKEWHSNSGEPLLLDFSSLTLEVFLRNSSALRVSAEIREFLSDESYIERTEIISSQLFSRRFKRCDPMKEWREFRGHPLQVAVWLKNRRFQ